MTIDARPQETFGEALVGLVEDVDGETVILRVSASILLLDVRGDPPSGIVGRAVLVRPDAFELYPTGVWLLSSGSLDELPTRSAAIECTFCPDLCILFSVADSVDLESAERALRLYRLPADYRSWCSEHDGVEDSFGDVYLVLYSLDDVVEASLQMREFVPGIVVIGSDGGGELFAFDGRSADSPIVMVPAIGLGWGDSIVQARSFGDFMTQRAAGEDLRWSNPSRAP